MPVTLEPKIEIPTLKNGSIVVLAEDIPMEKILNDVLTYTGMITLLTIMIGMGCNINWRQIIENLWPPVGILIGMTGQFILLPVLACFFAVVFQFQPYQAIGCLIMSCCPGGTFSNFFTYWLDGDVALSIVMTTCSSLMAFGTMPLNLWIYSRFLVGEEGRDFQIPYISIMKGLCFVCGPAIIGMVIRHCNQKVAMNITKLTSRLSTILIITQIVLFSYLYGDKMISSGYWIYVSGVTLPVVGFSLAYLIAFVLRRSHAHCRTIAIETSSQNMSIALGIIFLTYEDPLIRMQALTFPMFYGSFMMVEIIVVTGLFRLYLHCCGSKRKSIDPPSPE